VDGAEQAQRQVPRRLSAERIDRRLPRALLAEACVERRSELAVPRLLGEDLCQPDGQII
jgi:hypothetical protein